MNFLHLQSIVRMRWQMSRNQFRKSGRANRIVATIALVLAVLCSISAFVFALGWGRFFLAKMEPFYVIYVWDGLVMLFLFGWAMTLMIELQRSEMMSLNNLLHLPISLKNAFFLNYTSSLVSLVLLLFLPGAIGLCAASVMHFGTRSIVVFALLVAFLLMVTAITYQLRGWLARLMENKRTRGTVIAVMVLGFVLMSQVPNMINFGTMRSRNAGARALRDARDERQNEVQQRLADGKIKLPEYKKQIELIKENHFAEKEVLSEARVSALNNTTEFANLVVPIGWLPYGASAAARGSVFSPWLCVLGMSGIGLLSLSLARRSTVRTYTGHHNKGYRPASRQSEKKLSRGAMLEKSIPLMSDQQSVIALATFRSTLRAPEAKMALLTPMIFACVFGSMMFTGKMSELPAFVRPWIGISALCVSLLGIAQMMLNMFALDRQGFRAYVLMPAPRRDILLGKNMGIFPVAAVFSGSLIVFMGIAGNMHFTHIIATLLQVVVTLLIYFTISNYTSIVAPIGMATGSMKPVSMKVSVLVVQFVAVLLIPVAILPAVAALGTEQLAGLIGYADTVPIYLLATFVELPIAVLFYRKMLDLQGTLLQRREQQILDVISKVTD